VARRVRLPDTHRLIPSRYPPVGILDRVASGADLDGVFELEGWTNDRISAELGILHMLPRAEWLVGRPMASIVMAAFCHPRPGGGRFNDETRGAWYASLTLETAHAEVVYHRTKELLEIGVLDARLELRLYLADFDGRFHDLRAARAEYSPYYDPIDYTASQQLARDLLAAGSNGIVYRSVRQEGGFCVACFRPKLVGNVRQSSHFEYRWTGSKTPEIRPLRRR
jgi:hypothetical protein